jgi:TonB family protein
MRNRNCLFFLLLLFAVTRTSAQRDGRHVERYSLFHKKSVTHYKDHKRDGESVEWNRDGTIRRLAYYYQGVLDGPYMDNIMRCSGFYRMGKMDSLWTYHNSSYAYMDSFIYYKDGVPWKEAWTQHQGYSNRYSQWYFREGLRDSSFICMGPNGIKMAEGAYRMGKRTGTWLFYNGNSTPQSVWLYENDTVYRKTWHVSYGSWDKSKTEEEYEHGKPVRRHVVNRYDMTHMESEEFYVNLPGKPGAELKDSTWTTWRKTGEKVNVTHWKNGKKNGLEEIYDEKGMLKSTVTYRENLKNGPSVTYFPDGSIERSVSYANGRLYGEWTVNFFNHKPAQHYSYVNDTLNGVATTWFENGSKQTECTYVMGVLDGTFTEWDEQGKVIRTRKFKKSERMHSPFAVEKNDNVPVPEQVPVNPDSLLQFDLKNVFSYAEVMPEFPGGQQAMYQFLSSNIIYPETEKEAGVYGNVYVSFVVDVSGKVKNVKLVKGVKGGPGLDKEALRVFNMMPDWKPGLMNGRPVNVQMTIPVKFMIR